jgi:hypothetical protein
MRKVHYSQSDRSRFSMPTRAAMTFVALTLLLASSALADRGIEKELSASSGGQLVVKAAGAEIEVSTRARGAYVQITRGGDDAEDIRGEYEVEISESGGNVTVDIDRRKSWNPIKNLWPRPGLKVTIEVPAIYDLDLTSSGGDIFIGDIQGEVKGFSSGGDVSVENVKGDVEVGTSGGRIEIDRVDGDVVASTSGGSIQIEEVGGTLDAESSGGSIKIGQVAGPVKAETSGGSIDIESAGGAVTASTSGGGIRAHIHAQPTSSSRMVTSGGSVILYLDPSVAVDIDASSSGGRVISELPVRVTNFTSAKSKLTGQVNGGGPMVELRSSGGSIKILEP